MPAIRPPILSGSWYPAGAEPLARQVDDFLADADPTLRPAGRPLLAIVPHAGYAYSGTTAGRLFGLLAADRPKTIFILAPNHRAAINQVALSTSAAFTTPLGDVPVDQALVQKLAQNDAFVIDDQAHAGEHAVEILLPFLQRLWPNDPPRIVPMLVPVLSDVLRRAASNALSDLNTPDTLLLVSSDFTHYGQAYGYVPFTDDIPQALETLDTGAILKILAADADGLRQYGRDTGITMCGLMAADVALGCGLPQGYEAALVHYSRSGDRDRDYSLSVSYAAVLMCTGQAPESGGSNHVNA